MGRIGENPNIRISARSKAALRELSRQEGKPMQTVLDDAIERYRRDVFFRELDEGYARLQSNPEAWREELAERQLWDTALDDGLENE
jgi:hypothetical protein